MKVVIIALLCLIQPVCAQVRLSSTNTSKDFKMEKLINSLLVEYPFSQENMFRLAAYSELKGDYNNENGSMNLDFGSLGSMVIYPNTCILKTFDSRLFFLDKRKNTAAQVEAINLRVDDLLNHIFLLGNHQVDMEKVRFVDEHLSKKNIEPFGKIFLRHILIRYGKYDSNTQRIEFSTDWLPDQNYVFLDPSAKEIVVKPMRPMKVKLDKTILRGYYINSGGTVFVKDVDRKVAYATGEEYLYNVAAFKLFVQKMFTQTTQFIVMKENNRLAEMLPPASEESDDKQEMVIGETISGKLKNAFAYDSDASSAAQAYGKMRGNNKLVEGIKINMYDQFDWIPMMLGLLRSQQVNIGEPEIIKYFIDEPYFHRIYKQLTVEEREKVDKYLHDTKQ
ncbi:MAG: hypothetical protein AAFY71_16710 [Bacteroidota bacterium]